MDSEDAELRVDVETDPASNVVVTVIGDLDLAAAPTFVGAIDSMFAPAPASITLDLAGVSFLDSSGLGALLTLHAKCQSESVDFGAVNAPKQVSRVLELTKLTELFNLH